MTAFQRFVDMPESSWPECAALMPQNIAADFRDYVDACLVPVDFMPSPTVAGSETVKSETAIEQMKRKLRPKYVALHQFWQSQGGHDQGEGVGSGSGSDSSTKG